MEANPLQLYGASPQVDGQLQTPRGPHGEARGAVGSGTVCSPALGPGRQACQLAKKIQDAVESELQMSDT